MPRKNNMVKSKKRRATTRKGKKSKFTRKVKRSGKQRGGNVNGNNNNGNFGFNNNNNNKKIKFLNIIRDNVIYRPLLIDNNKYYVSDEEPNELYSHKENKFKKENKNVADDGIRIGHYLYISHLFDTENIPIYNRKTQIYRLNNTPITNIPAANNKINDAHLYQIENGEMVRKYTTNTLVEGVMTYIDIHTEQIYKLADRKLVPVQK